MRKQQAAQTEADLKAAAIRVFGRIGYLNAKITDITAEAGRAAGSFYTYFPNKEALLEALLADLLAEGDASAVDARHLADFSDREAIRWHISAYWEVFRRHRTVLVALQQAATVDESFGRRARDLVEPDMRHIAAHLRLAQQAGVVLPGDPMVLATVFTLLVSGYANLWLGGPAPDLGRELSDEEAIETLTSFIFAGIGGVNAGQ